MGHSTYQDDSEFSEINIVPFVDIILVVLIIFMLTAPMIIQPNIAINLPKASSSNKGAPSKLSISINSNGQIFLGSSRVAIGNLKQKVKAAAAQSSETQAIISADRSVSHGLVVKVLDQVKLAGIKKLAISTSEK